MPGLSSFRALVVVWSFSFCNSVQVFAKGAHGLVRWTDAPNWRDRSVVPTPPPEDVAAYKKREKIPYPYPKVVKHVYVGSTSGKEGRKRKLKKKKNVIQRIFFSLPVGAELPIYYTHQKAGPHKKSSIASQVPGGHRYFFEDSENPYRGNTWGLQRRGNEEVTSELESRTIAKQNLISPDEGGLAYHGIGSQYLRPQTVERYRVIKDSGQFFKKPSRTEPILNVYRRSRKSKTLPSTAATPAKEPTLSKHGKEERKLATKFVKAATRKSEQDSDSKKSGLPKGLTLD